jgi:hypothetical protein
MSGGLGSVAVRFAVVRATPALSAQVISSIAVIVFALTLIFATSGYAQEPASQKPPLQRHSLLSFSKQLKGPQSFIIKASCPSYSSCCCVIGGYAACMTSSECSALGGGCTGRC